MSDFPYPSSAPVASGLSCSRRDDGHVATVTVAGELDMATSRQLDRELRGSGDAAMIVLDLRAVEFIDSTGLHVILDAHDRLRASGGRLLVVRGPAPVHRMFALTGVDGIVELVDRPPALGEGSGRAVA